MKAVVSPRCPRKGRGDRDVGELTIGSLVNRVIPQVQRGHWSSLNFSLFISKAEVGMLHDGKSFFGAKIIERTPTIC